MRADPTVFVSYAASDRAFAGRLAADLTAVGARLAADPDRCDVLVSVLSPNGLTSAWVQQAWETAVRRQRAGDRCLVVPALLPEGELPPPLRGLPAADFRHDYSAGWAGLASAVWRAADAPLPLPPSRPWWVAPAGVGGAVGLAVVIVAAALVWPATKRMTLSTAGGKPAAPKVVPVTPKQEVSRNAVFAAWANDGPAVTGFPRDVTGIAGAVTFDNSVDVDSRLRATCDAAGRAIAELKKAVDGCDLFVRGGNASRSLKSMDEITVSVAGCGRRFASLADEYHGLPVGTTGSPVADGLRTQFKDTAERLTLLVAEYDAAVKVLNAELAKVQP